MRLINELRAALMAKHNMEVVALQLLEQSFAERSPMPETSARSVGSAGDQTEAE